MKKKCEFFQDEISYLGFIINKTGLKADPKKVEGITRAPAPENVSQLKSFIGMVNFYRKFVPNISQKLTPLYDLCKEKVVWIWTPECNKAFENIKNELISANVLVHFNSELPIKLIVDASDWSWGCVTTLTSAQKRYSQIEKEALAIKYAVGKFEQYLFAQKIYTDYGPSSVGLYFWFEKGDSANDSEPVTTLRCLSFWI